MTDSPRIKLIVAVHVVDELNSLIDSLDEHVTIEDVGRALGELRDKIIDSTPKPYQPSEEEKGRMRQSDLRAWKNGYPA